MLITYLVCSLSLSLLPINAKTIIVKQIIPVIITPDDIIHTFLYFQIYPPAVFSFPLAQSLIHAEHIPVIFSALYEP